VGEDDNGADQSIPKFRLHDLYGMCEGFSVLIFKVLDREWHEMLFVGEHET
jgi:hypothetical protein